MLSNVAEQEQWDELNLADRSTNLTTYHRPISNHNREVLGSEAFLPFAVA